MYDLNIRKALRAEPAAMPAPGHPAVIKKTDYTNLPICDKLKFNGIGNGQDKEQQYG